MVRSRTVPPQRVRVGWLPGDKHGERQKWSRDAAAYANLKKRPSVAALIKVIEPHLNAQRGYTWITNAQILIEMSGNYSTAIERAMQIADHELGLIERETTVVRDEAGRVIGRNRRIYATRPVGMIVALEAYRALKAAPNPKTGQNFAARSNRSSQQIQLETGIVAPTSGEIYRPPSTNHRALNRYPNGSGNREDRFGSEERVSLHTGLHSSFGGPVTAVVNSLALVGPADTSPDRLIDIGREAWRVIKKGNSSRAESEAIVGHLFDAAERAWLDHLPEVQRMVIAMSDLVGVSWDYRRTASR